MGSVDLAFFSNSRVADHLQYLALPGILALSPAWRAPGGGWRGHWPPALAVAALAWLTCQHEKVLAAGANSEGQLAKNPNSWKVCMNLSQVLLQEGRTDEAIQLKNRAETLLHPAAETAK